MEVTVASGDMAGYRALVVSAPAEALDRPVIRIFADPWGSKWSRSTRTCGSIRT